MLIIWEGLGSGMGLREHTLRSREFPLTGRSFTCSSNWHVLYVSAEDCQPQTILKNQYAAACLAVVVKHNPSYSKTEVALWFLFTSTSVEGST